MQKGITLVETVVAVTVLTMALGGPFLLAARSLHSAAYAREEVAAARLAEEGLEIMHNIRDNDAADAGRAWNTIVTTCSGSGCLVDVTQQTGSGGAAASIWGNAVISTCGGGGCTLTHSGTTVYQDSVSGLYRQAASDPGGTWRDTSMHRLIKITMVGSANREYTIESEVSYVAGRVTRSVKLQDTIMNWFPRLNGADKGY